MKMKSSRTRRVMEDAHNGVVYSEDDNALRENNKKKTVKTNAQVQPLEKFYHESMKMQLTEKISLTEKQVSGWFCHRRLKDKRLTNEGNDVIITQDRSSGVIQDHESGHVQDSCGSTKQADITNFDTREVESERLTLHDYYRMDGASSGSNSSLWNMADHHRGKPFDVATSRYLVPKFPTDTMGAKSPRLSPMSYLLVKGQAENTAITAVKGQLGKHYREDGPPLSVEYDLLPPGAFESSMQNPADGETCYTGDTVLSALPDFSQIHQYPKFGKERGYYSGRALSQLTWTEQTLNCHKGPIFPIITFNKSINIILFLLFPIMIVSTIPGGALLSNSLKVLPEKIW